MQLIELEPHWAAEASAPEGTKQGVTFLCPCCRSIRLGVFFKQPIVGPSVDLDELRRSRRDDGHLADTHLGATLWQREGETFGNLSLSPSIDASAFGHWHGVITNGEIR